MPLRRLLPIMAARWAVNGGTTLALADLLSTDERQEFKRLRREDLELRHRAGLVRLGTTLKNRVHAVLADRGVQLTGPL